MKNLMDEWKRRKGSSVAQKERRQQASLSHKSRSRFCLLVLLSVLTQPPGTSSSTFSSTDTLWHCASPCPKWKRSSAYDTSIPPRATPNAGDATRGSRCGLVHAGFVQHHAHEIASQAMLMRLRGAGKQDADQKPEEDEIFRPRVLEDELGADSIDSRIPRDSSILLESSLRAAKRGARRGATLQGTKSEILFPCFFLSVNAAEFQYFAAEQDSFFEDRKVPLQPPPDCNQKWEDMNFPDRIMNYIKARIKEEEDDPEYKNWWKGLLIFTVCVCAHASM